jgi:uncharacterized cupin superfamily protein
MDHEAQVVLLQHDDAARRAQWVGMSVGELDAGETLAMPSVHGTVTKSGFWRHGGGSLPYARPDSTEVIHLIGGEARIADGRGTVVTLAAGDTCIVRVGFEGEWTTVQPVTKLSFSIVETATKEQTHG